MFDRRSQIGLPPPRTLHCRSFRSLRRVWQLARSLHNRKGQAGRTRNGRELQPAVHRPQLVVLGYSLTAGLGVAQDESYSALIRERLESLVRRWSLDLLGLCGKHRRDLSETACDAMG